MNRNHTTAILAILMLVSAALPRAATREQDHLLDDMPASVTTTISAPDYPALGERLVLPDWLEDRRDEIEAGLPALPDGHSAR